MAKIRIQRFGSNSVAATKGTNDLRLFFRQFKSPIVILFVAAAALSYFLEDPHDAIIIFVIVFISAGLGFWQERGATDTIRKLLALVKTRCHVIRGSRESEIDLEDIVPGDVIILRAGDKVPGDCRLVESRDLFVNEAILTGESYPVEKDAAISLPQDTGLNRRVNSVYMGSYVISGMAHAIVVRTGKDTELGRISAKLKTGKPETDFEHGVRRLGYFLAEVTLILVVANFAVNIYLHRSVLDSFLFSLALAIGLTPQLLPAIISVNIAHGAKRMASKHVIIKRLASIENLGSMNILCSDKTGTLTAGSMEVFSTTDVLGQENESVLFYSYLNSINESGFENPIDQAIVRAGKNHGFDTTGYQKMDEIPYDFQRKRLSILLRTQDSKHEHKVEPKLLMITKGAVQNVLEICSQVEVSGKVVELDTNYSKQIHYNLEEMSKKGFRVLAVSYHVIGNEAWNGLMTNEDERNSIFLGFLVLSDPIRADAPKSVKALQKRGISLKIISGDNRSIAKYIGSQVGLDSSKILVGSELDKISPDAIGRSVSEVQIFAEVEPRQKERIILALKKSGNVVGYIGDGVNDAPALHAADVGISVDTAADVLKEEADIVLLDKDLLVLADGVEEGRRTFANTLKYVFMATSANFGNMFSTATASFFLSFIPMLPKQILLNNLLTDTAEMTIASDRVEDMNILRTPSRWNFDIIKKFMLVFGILSAVFDFATFAALYFVLNASIEQFRTAWFIESVVSASVAILAVRSRKPLLRTNPGRYLLLTSLAVAVVSMVVVPLTIVGNMFGLVILPIQFYGWIALIVVMYIASIELVKRFFFWRSGSAGRVNSGH